ncbi:CoA transferase [Nocardia gamkensis]|uniref:CoA transferase n=1 Tax=Nocardia gamkensis TaxID=352869 RepID=UPI0037C54039
MVRPAGRRGAVLRHLRDRPRPSHGGGSDRGQALRETAGTMGIDEAPRRQRDRSVWPIIREKISGTFATRTMAQWCEVFDGSDACVAPVVSLREAASQPHVEARGSNLNHSGTVQSAPAPRFRCHGPRSAIRHRHPVNTPGPY